MKILKSICRIIFKLTGIPSLFLLLRQRYYLSDPYRKTRIVKGGAILIANHSHIMDFFALTFAHPFRRQRFLVSEAIYEHRFLGFLCDIVDSILVHRERSDLSFMGEAEKTLLRGGVVSIFPEGHLVHNGKLDTFKPSVIYLALRSKAPIIPHYIDAHYFSFKRTRIIVGKPIYVSDYLGDNPTSDEVKQFCEFLRQKTNELKRKMSLYRKYRTRSIINFKAWFLDLTKVILWLPTKFIFPVKFHYVNGASKLDRKIIGKGIITSKHRGFNDAPILAMHHFSRRVHIIVASELYQIMGWLLKHLLSIKYERSSDVADPKCFLEVINTLKAEGVVGIYPEGHIEEDKIGHIAEGAAYFALMSNSPIHFYYMARKYKPFHFNHVIIGKTIYVDKLFTKEEMKDKKTIVKLTAMIEQEFSELEEACKIYKK